MKWGGGGGGGGGGVMGTGEVIEGCRGRESSLAVAGVQRSPQLYSFVAPFDLMVLFMGPSSI